MFIIDTIRHWYGRCKNGYSFRDAWAFDEYLCNILPPVIRGYKDNIGCPGSLYDKKRVNDECWKWREILEEMAQGFESAEEIKGTKIFKRIKQLDGCYSLEVDKKKLKLFSKKYDRGMKLFSEYFLNLWD